MTTHKQTPEKAAEAYAEQFPPGHMHFTTEDDVKHLLMCAWLAGYRAALESAEVLVLREACERVYKLSLLGTNPISIEAARILSEALAALKRGRGES